MVANILKFISPSWDEIYNLCFGLARRIRSLNGGFDCIVTIARGGLIPARILSDFLEIKDIYAVGIEYYTDIAKTDQEPRITSPISVDLKGASVLLIDDVADTGESLAVAESHTLQKGAKRVTIATVYLKPWSKVQPPLHAAETDAWVIFPWERLEALKSLVNKVGFDATKETSMPRSLVDELLDLSKAR